MKKFKVGIQLYSLRDAMEKDMDATLKAVKEMGYDYVEFAGYFGKSAEEVRAMLDKYGLECISVHQAIGLFEEEGKAAVDYLNTIGAKYCAIPWYEADKYYNNWDETVKKFAAVSELLKKGNIQLMYHNHDFEFGKIDGEYILDKLYSTLPSDVLMPQLDTCWVHYAGVNPAEYVRKYSGRMKVLHLKDFVCEKLGGGPVYALIDEDGNEMKPQSRDESGFKFVPVGSGIQDWESILSAAEDAGIDYVIVEQDMSVDRDPIEAAKMSRDYLKSLGL
ncbi:MAG: sugar phosphate isomerase/epimerase [Clostridia bacterium]|nr:sugar phosphate isomerase/epimerase [Clostridia bacterium]